MLNVLQYTIQGVSLPDLRGRDNCRDSDLADIVFDCARQFTGDGSHPGRLPAVLTDEVHVRRLIEVAFLTSLWSKEGRFPRVTLCVQDRIHSWFSLFSVEPPLDFTVGNLRSVAPMCTGSPIAVDVMAEAGKLSIVGCSEMGFDQSEFRSGMPGYSVVSGPFCFRIDIIGPGHLRANLGWVSFELHAGRIVQVSGFRGLPAVGRLLEEFGNAVEERLIASGKVPSLVVADIEASPRSWFGGLTHVGFRLAELLLKEILATTWLSQHGGTLLILPPDFEQSAQNVLSGGISTSGPDLGAAVDSHVLACVDFWNPNENPKRECRLQIVTYGRMIQLARAVGRMSAVDGCVVVDRNLKAIAFGRRINVSFEDADSSSIQFVKAQSREVMNFLELHGNVGGTRHQSACRFVKRVPGSVTIVCSQDGQIKVFWSDTDSQQAFAFGPVLFDEVPSKS